MSETEIKGLQRVIVVKEGDSKSGTCDECRDHQGEFCLDENFDFANFDFPPYHPNCVCEAEIEERETAGPFCDSNGYNFQPFGTERDAVELYKDSKAIFEKFVGQDKWRGAAIISNWYLSRTPLVEDFYSKKVDSCNQLAENLVAEFLKKFPPSHWYEFSYKYSYHEMWHFLPHAWVELTYKFIDHHGNEITRTIRFDPYYKKSTWEK